MFTNASRNAVICLRCQLRLGRQLRPYSVASNAVEVIEDHDEAHTYVPRPAPRPKRLGKTLRGRKVARLGIEALGKPAEVLILSDNDGHSKGQQAASSGNGQKEEATDDRRGSPEILEVIHKEQSQLGPEEVKANIEKFGVSFQHHAGITPKQWSKLRNRIQQSFTATQMSQYIGDYLKIRGGRETETTPANRTISAAVWTPGQTPLAKESPEAKEHTTREDHKSHRMNGKAALAERIMRECWKCYIKDEMGELDIHLRPHELSVLLMHNSQPLKDFAERLHVQIDASRSENLIRITGEEYPCERARKAVRIFLKDLRSMKIDLNIMSKHRHRKFHPEVWEGFFHGRGTPVESAANGSKLIIHYLAPDYSTAEKTRRDILFAHQIPSTKSTSLSWIHPYKGLAYMYPVTPPVDLMTIESKKTWGRWTGPMKKPNSQKTDIEATVGDTIKSKGSKAYFEVNSFIEGTNKLKPEYQPGQQWISERTSATVGLILLPGLPEGRVKPLGAGPLKKKTPERRLLSTDIPNTMTLLSDLKSIQPNKSTSQIIRLIPSPMESPKLPPIEIELDRAPGLLASNRRPTIRSMNAILGERVGDLLLPNNPVDLRFTKRTYYDLIGSSTNDRTKPLHSFLFATWPEAKPEIGQPFELPRFMRIRLPTKLLSRYSNKHTEDEDPPLESQAAVSPAHDINNRSHFTEAEYICPGLDASDLATFNYGGLKLNYNNLRGGRLLGDRRELRLAMERAEPTQDGSVKKLKFEDFFRRSCQLAFEIGSMKPKEFEIAD